MRWILRIAILILMPTSIAFSQTNGSSASSGEKFGSDALIGTWAPDDNAFYVKIEKIGSKYYGKLVWLQNPNDGDGNPKTDVNNPDPSLRETPFIGLRTMRDMEYTGGDTWGKGTIYDPETGKTYDCKITMNDSKDEADIRGFVGISLLGKTVEFHRVTE